MGCNCNKKKKSTGWGGGTARLAPTADPVPAPSDREVDNGPTSVTFADGSTETYSTRMDAHMAKIRAGGGTLSTSK